jgi:hypothetical protein
MWLAKRPEHIGAMDSNTPGMQYDVPFSSQYTDLGSHEWRARGCGIASLHMVMAYWHGCDLSWQLPTLNDLLERGRAIGAYREGIGWSHAGLVDLACRYGYNGYNMDFGPKSLDPKPPREAWDELLGALAGGPVMASVYAGLNPARGGGHIVVVTGVRNGLVFFNDPEEMNAWEGKRILSEDAFLRAFKLRAIIVRPAGRLPVR